jgi:hypothetical protein
MLSEKTWYALLQRAVTMFSANKKPNAKPPPNTIKKAESKVMFIAQHHEQALVSVDQRQGRQHCQSSAHSLGHANQSYHRDKPDYPLNHCKLLFSFFKPCLNSHQSNILKNRCRLIFELNQESKVLLDTPVSLLTQASEGKPRSIHAFDGVSAPPLFKVAKERNLFVFDSPR